MTPEPPVVARPATRELSIGVAIAFTIMAAVCGLAPIQDHLYLALFFFVSGLVAAALARFIFRPQAPTDFPTGGGTS